VAEHDEDDVSPRSFWAGTITFGLVSIPVELYPASRTQRVSLRMVAPDGTPLARRYFCPREGRALEWDEIVRGYQVAEGEYVVVTDEELEKLAPEKTRDIDLRRFVPAEDLAPIYFERAYYLTPGGNSTKAYRLLAATMEQTGRAGIATFVMRGKEYLVAILAENGILRAETLRFADEVRTPEDVGLPQAAKPKAAVVKQIEKEIVARAADGLDEAELADRAAERLLQLVAEKERSGEGVVDAPAGAVGAPSEGVIDLMEVLRRSLQGGAAAGEDRGGGKAGGGAAGEDRAGGKAGGGARRARGGAQRSGTSAAARRTGGGGQRSATGRGGGRRTQRGGRDLARQSKQQLYERAKRLGIPGRSGMNKDQLIEALRHSA
jgi:DNA end-binding protein Ku